MAHILRKKAIIEWMNQATPYCPVILFDLPTSSQTRLFNGRSHFMQKNGVQGLKVKSNLKKNYYTCYWAVSEA
jgi:hypothetical protein